MKPVLVIHGGAGTQIPTRAALNDFNLSIKSVLNSVYKSLVTGASAVESVALAVSLLEDDCLFNAGLGSKLQCDGRARMSAAVMDGWQRRFGGCLDVEGVRNPVRLAYKLLEQNDRVLSGAGARQFAREHGLKFRSAMTLKRKREHVARLKGLTGTVGAVALDNQGRLAAATSTGGRGFEWPHRVSDSATCAGTFANRNCAASATGVGEEIVEWALAASICLGCGPGRSLTQVSNQHVKAARAAGARFGFIAVDRFGKITAQTTTKNLIWGAVDHRGTLLPR